MLVIKKVKNTVLWALFISDVKGNLKEIFGTFYERELQKPN